MIGFRSCVSRSVVALWNFLHAQGLRYKKLHVSEQERLDVAGAKNADDNIRTVSIRPAWTS